MGRFEVFQKRDGLLLAEISFAILSVLCKLIPQTVLDDPSQSDRKEKPGTDGGEILPHSQDR